MTMDGENINCEMWLRDQIEKAGPILYDGLTSNSKDRARNLETQAKSGDDA